MAKKNSITIEIVRKLIHYNPETGVFTWLPRTAEMFKAGKYTAEHNSNLWNNLFSGKKAGTAKGDGYFYIEILGVRIRTHRLAWFYMTGEWPIEVDHEDTDPGNNKWKNLRLATHAQNSRNSKIRTNNTSGYKGVHWHKTKQKWTAQIRLNDKIYYLGQFPTPETAYAAYCKAAKELHGEFARVA